jgi:non-ribosomal peptide synthetase component F/thioesterase domain-containing protein
MSPKSTTLASTPPAADSAGEEFFAFPLTPAQRAMWPRDRKTPGDPRYNGAFRMELAGAVDLELLQRSLREVAQRQESLRTSFRVLDNGEIQQVVFPISDLFVDEVDLRSFPEATRAAMLDELSTKEATQTFDLTQGAPIRVKLLRMEDRRAILTITVHQIVCDGWSIGLLMEELAANYAAFARQEPSPLAPLDFQYGDYVAWRQESATNAPWGEIRKQLDYWKQRLDGCPQPRVAPDLDGDPNSPEAGIVSTLLPRELTDALRSVAQAENTTFFVVTMAACMVLLSRYTGDAEVALRTPLAGRTRVEFEPIIGQFVNQVVIRGDAARNLTLSGFIAQVRESVWEALANQDACFEDVLESIALPGAAGGCHCGVNDSLFRINFVCQKEYGRNGPSQFEFDGVRMTTMPSKSQGALYDLNFFLVEREIGWRLSLEYRAGLYTQETAASLLQHFEEILRQVAEAPRRGIGELGLSATEALTKRMQDDASFSISVSPVIEEDSASPEVLAMPGSLAQERFWTLSQLDPANPSFHVPLVMRLSGPLSAQLLEKSLQLLIDRHESLRTTFAEKDGEFLQIIHPAWPVGLEVASVPGPDEAEKSRNVAAAIQKEIHRPFDLKVLPLFRTILLKLGDEEHVLIMTLHHILADAASAQVVQRELWTTYESLRAGRQPSLPELSIQYGDFSVWQRENLESEAMKSHLAYWLKQLSGDLKVLNFPTDHPPAYRPTSKGGVETRLLPEALTRSLKQLAQANETTLFVVTLACFAAMLSRAAEAEDVVIGSPVLNRRPETEALIGPFAGPMAFRLKLAGDPTLSGLIAAARDLTLEALDHADLPFELILRNLTLRTQNERRPLFQFYFLCQTAFVQSRQVDALRVTPLPSVSVGTPFEMQLAMIERPEGLRAELEYNADLFDKATVDQWLVYYESLLNAVVGNPGQRLSGLPSPPFKPAAQYQESGNSAASASHLEQPYVAPRDLVEEMLAQIWEGVLGVPSISVHANFFDIGGTSLMILKMVPRINAAFELVLPVPTIFKAPTIELMANVIKQRSTIEKQVVLPLHPSGTRPPLFMVHSYHLYRALPAALGNDQPFYGVMELELSDRHTPYTLRDQVATYIQHIREVQPKGPYYVAGFCFFGLLAFEVAAQLEALGEKVAFVGLIDTYCPEYWSKRQPSQTEIIPSGGALMPTSTAPLWHHLRKTANLRFREKMVAHANFIGHKLRNRGLSMMLEARVSLYTFFIKRGLRLPSWLNDPALVTRVGVRRHAPAKLVSDIYLFPAEDVPLEADFDPTLGWGTMTSGKVQTFWIPGDHEDMFKEKNIGALAKTIREAMDAARG